MTIYSGDDHHPHHHDMIRVIREMMTRTMMMTPADDHSDQRQRHGEDEALIVVGVLACNGIVINMLVPLFVENSRPH